MTDYEINLPSARDTLVLTDYGVDSPRWLVSSEPVPRAGVSLAKVYQGLTDEVIGAAPAEAQRTLRLLREGKSPRQIAKVV